MSRRRDEIVFGALALTVWLSVPALAGVVGWRWGAEWGEAVDRSACAALIPEVRGLRVAIEESVVVPGVRLRRERKKNKE